jgi:hypothetical protein
LSVVVKQPHPNQIEELQSFYNSKDCGTKQEREGVEQTYRNLIADGYSDLKLYKQLADGSLVEVDLFNGSSAIEMAVRSSKAKAKRVKMNSDEKSDGISSGGSESDD